MPERRADRIAGGGLPHPGGVVVGGGHDARTVTAEGNRVHGRVMAHGVADRQRGHNVPHHDIPIGGCGRDVMAVRAEGDGADGSGVAQDGTILASVIPHTGEAIERPGDHASRGSG